MALDKVGATIGGVLKSLTVALDSNGNIASAHTTVDQNGVAIGVAQDGTDSPAISPPAGGVGIRGWLSGLYGIGTSILTALGGILKVNVQNASLAVTGTFFPATQPVSVIALPLPTGAATAANQPAINADGGALSHVMNFPAMQAISATALPLPTGAADAVTLAAINTKLGALLAAEQPYQGVVAMVVGTAQAAQRAIRINCSAAGNVSLTYADGSVDVIPVSVGLSYIAGAITTINNAGTTATATYAAMK